ncbi:hypothetical protein CRM22_011247 [Opisthorchis felineus]|uniref:Long-chain specific acyl-CoA dehydrogenase, mitochondrial n=1 Tax=Opisthorchis felineus TaxID=147828 RepID=A0A4S2JYR6_OPIFE|nr:hypothetical protein CRM22_011247 [Opisthorchis felineus]
MSRCFLRPCKLFRTFVSRYSSRPEGAQASSLMDIGTRRIFSEEHDIFRATVRKFVKEHIVPKHDKWELQGQIDRETWLQAGQDGLLGIAIPESDGGHGGDILSAAIVVEELCYANCSGPGFSLHSDIVMPYISHYGTPEQKKIFIPRMTKGEVIGAIAMTEPSAGSDLQGIRTTAKRDGNDWILNGSKVFITNGYMADVVIAVAVTNPDAKSKAHGISLFLVEEGMAGFSKGRKLHKMGFKAQDTAELFFEDVRVPNNHLLGKENHGFYMLMRELPQERLIIALLSQALGEFVFEETRSYVKSRKAFGQTLSGLQWRRYEKGPLHSAGNLPPISFPIAVTRLLGTWPSRLSGNEGPHLNRRSYRVALIIMICTGLRSLCCVRCLEEFLMYDNPQFFQTK